jgi:hypothetical protein
LPQVIGKVNVPVKSGKDHIFLRLGLLRSPYSAQKNVAYARTLSAIMPVGTNRRIGLYGAKERALSAKL